MAGKRQSRNATPRKLIDAAVDYLRVSHPADPGAAAIAMISRLRRDTELPTRRADALLASIVENRGFGLLMRDRGFFAAVAGGELPLHSRDELVDRLAGLAAHLEADRGHLLRTGLPRRWFRPSAWLGERLLRLYDLKATTSPWPADRFRRELADHEPGFRFLPPAEQGSAEWPFDLSHLDAGRRCRPPQPFEPADPAGVRQRSRPAVDYDDARLLAVFAEHPPLKLDRITSLRPILLELKIELLREAAEFVRRGYPAVFRRTLDRLVEVFPSADLDLLLGFDHDYLRGQFPADGPVGDGAGMDPGGVSNLLAVAGHLDREADLRRYSRLREQLGEAAGVDEDGDASLEVRAGRSTYLRLAARGRLERLSAAADTYFEDEAGSIARWESDRCEAKEELVAVNAFEAIVARSSLGSGWTTSDAVTPSAEAPAAGTVPDREPQNVFRRQGDTWEIRWRGSDSIHLKHSRGLERLHVLIRHRGRLMSPAEVESAIADPEATPCRADADTEGLHVVAGADEILDDEAAKDYRRRLEKLGSERREAEARNDAAELDRIDRASEVLRSELMAAFTRTGESRTLDPVARNAANTFGKTLKAASKTIGVRLPELAQHFGDFGRRNGRFQYAPSPPVDWVVN